MEKGWYRFNEVNRVVFDPERVSVGEMEEWLREAGTYIRTVIEAEAEKGKQGIGK